MTANHALTVNIVGKKVPVGGGHVVYAKASVDLTSPYTRDLDVSGVEELKAITIKLGNETTKNTGSITVTGVEQLRVLANYFNKVADKVGEISVGGEGIDLI